jgi:hypothetical protein
LGPTATKYRGGAGSFRVRLIILYKPIYNRFVAPLARRALRDWLAFEFAHTHGGLIWQVPKLRSIFSRWHFLPPELGRFLPLVSALFIAN